MGEFSLYGPLEEYQQFPPAGDDDLEEGEIREDEPYVPQEKYQPFPQVGDDELEEEEIREESAEREQGEIREEVSELEEGEIREEFAYGERNDTEYASHNSHNPSRDTKLANDDDLREKKHAEEKFEEASHEKTHEQQNLDVGSQNCDALDSESSLLEDAEEKEDSKQSDIPRDASDSSTEQEHGPPSHVQRNYEIGGNDDSLTQVLQSELQAAGDAFNEEGINGGGGGGGGKEQGSEARAALDEQLQLTPAQDSNDSDATSNDETTDAETLKSEPTDEELPQDNAAEEVQTDSSEEPEHKPAEKSKGKSAKSKKRKKKEDSDDDDDDDDDDAPKKKKPPRQHSAASLLSNENITLPVHGQTDWSIDNLPEILYVFRPTTNQPRRYPQMNEKSSPYQGERSLRDFNILPDRISSNVEEFRVEAWMRHDRRIQLHDITDRMHPSFRVTNNTLQQRGVRFRQAFSMMAWGSGSRKTQEIEAEIEGKLIQNGIDPQLNSTRSLTPGLIDPNLGETGGRIPVPGQYMRRYSTSTGNTANTICLTGALNGTAAHNLAGGTQAEYVASNFDYAMADGGEIPPPAGEAYGPTQGHTTDQHLPAPSTSGEAMESNSVFWLPDEAPGSITLEQLYAIYGDTDSEDSGHRAHIVPNDSPKFPPGLINTPNNHTARHDQSPDMSNYIDVWSSYHPNVQMDAIDDMAGLEVYSEVGQVYPYQPEFDLDAAHIRDSIVNSFLNGYY